MAALVKYTTKFAIGVGAIYTTAAQGVWSNTTEGSVAASKIKERVLPEQSQPEQVQERSFQDTVLNTWNSGVQKTFSGIASTPTAISDYGKKAVVELKNKLTST